MKSTYPILLEAGTGGTGPIEEPLRGNKRENALNHGQEMINTAIKMLETLTIPIRSGYG